LTAESVRTGVLFSKEVTHLETDRRLTLGDTDADVTGRTVVEEWILKRTVGKFELAHDADLFGTDLTDISVLLTESGRPDVTVRTRTFVTE